MINKVRPFNRSLKRGKAARDFKKEPLQHRDEQSPSSDNKKPKYAFFGLLVRRKRWAPSLWGRLALFVSMLLLGRAVIWRIQPFLAVTQPVDSRYLVVEGWVPNYALEESIAEFKSKPYKLILTVGADPVVNFGGGDSGAVEARKRLEWMGVDPNALKAVPAQVKYRNRTYESAIALRKWFADNRVPLTSFNLVTLGAHARRSRLLFEEAFGGQVKIGIIAVQNREFDPKRWWKYSEGVREVLGEVIGYLYVRLAFHPARSANL